MTWREAAFPSLAAILLISGCAASPHLGTDEGRAAVVWENPSLAPVRTPPPQGTEQKLVDEVHDAEANKDKPLDFAQSLYELAILRRQQGAFGEAESLYRRALEIREREQGPDHPDLATVLNNLAVLKATLGDYDAAEPLLERALQIRESALGEEHLLTAQSLSNLALLRAARGDAEGAEPLYRRSLAILERPGSEPPHTDLARVLDNYAALLHETGRDGEARALEARARSLGAVSEPGSPPHRE